MSTVKISNGILYLKFSALNSCLNIQIFICSINIIFSCLEKFCVHSVLTLIYMVEMFIMFILMVIFMTYNVYFCICVLLGIGIGYFCFGSSRVSAGHH